jgi:hypothetical protein
LLRCVILAFTGDHAATALDAPETTIEPSAAVTAMQTLDQLGSGLAMTWLPVAAYQVITGSGL